LTELTVADDPARLDTVEHETNLPQFIKTGLRRMYPA
jgi:hypothetical protein